MRGYGIRIAYFPPTNGWLHLHEYPRCGRDFTKLVKRIADQKRFEEEQCAARAEEQKNTINPADGTSSPRRNGEGGDSSGVAESGGGRKPKGLVWDVSEFVEFLSAAPSFLSPSRSADSRLLRTILK